MTSQSNQISINNNHGYHLLRDYYVPDTCTISFNPHNDPGGKNNYYYIIIPILKTRRVGFTDIK